ncbi:MAG: HPF/RaiA family ribosome-associated protein [Patescibacteria group bacterium]
MQIHFKGTNYELPANITALARKKVEALTKYIGDSKENARAYVDLGKETEAHQNGTIWRADINFDVEGNRFYAKAIENSIEKAIDRSVNELARELQTARKRQQSLMKKGGGVIKSLMRGLEA